MGADRYVRGGSHTVFRFALALVEIGLVLYCLIDCIQSPEAEIRNLPRWAWLVLILLLPDIGAIAWLVAGRPRAATEHANGLWPRARTAGGPSASPARGPDDDAGFLAGLRRADEEHKDVLRQWEDDLRRREEQLRRSAGDDGPSGPAEGPSDGDLGDQPPPAPA